MFFVPMVPPQPPSPRTRELADLLGRVIEEYEKHHPAVTGSEVRAAMEMATRSSKAAGAPAAAALMAGLVGLVLAGGFVFMAVNGGDVSAADVPIAAVVAVLIGILGVAFLLKRLAGK